MVRQQGRPRKERPVAGEKSDREQQGKASTWIAAYLAARQALNIEGFSFVKKGTALYKKAKELHDLLK